MTKLRKISVEKSPSVSSPRKNFSCRQRSPKMAELRKDSVKNLRLYHLPSKKFLVPKKGILKWPSCDKKFCEKPPSPTLEKFSSADKWGDKMTKLRKFSVKTSVSIIPPRKNVLVLIKGVLKWLSCEKF